MGMAMAMGEISFIALCGVMLTGAWVFYWIWWRPMKVERGLKEQGIRGHPYRLLFGNKKEEARLRKEALSKPVGSLSHNIVGRVIPFVHHTIQTYGEMSLSWNGRTPIVYVTDPELVKDILFNKFGHFERDKLNPLTKLLVKGLVSYDGEKWATHRRIINPAFHPEKLKGMLPAFSTSCSELITRWERLADSKGSCEVDMWPELQILSRDVISRSAFGSSYEEGRRIFELQYELAHLVVQAAMSIYIPGFRFLPTKKNKRMKEIAREVRALLEEMVNKREEILKKGGGSTNDLLGLLLKYNQEHDISKDVRMSIDDVIEECKLFYFAGQETTSVLLTWTMIVLSIHPEWQLKAKEEVLQVFGRNKPDFDGLNHLKIVTMILYEVLRLYPPVVMLNRYTNKKIRLREISFPSGVLFSMPVVFLHHSKELWGEDAQEFNPERFSGGVLNATNNHVSFYPFGWGPRLCIGQNFALLEAKMALTMILQHFQFELSPSYCHAPHKGLTLEPQYGAQIILHKL
ncbi:PREDICTED: cytochrome P450 CYP72A219-like [Nelumbo nucifera]|uniref:Cytochrome P450 CYP72A219-like n=2 Tax=Nelumbo nucifera TaxID=4432 RepID=A0A1U7YU60_NELNU|nr:PREDICTED: cytochrome P450 CYP72A219-like [Nelumbo nucifera]DAD37475.1 TPA_asm: hypothetical protein HUJ06_008116 [Nelumbo nucifera]